MKCKLSLICHWPWNVPSMERIVRCGTPPVACHVAPRDIVPFISTSDTRVTRAFRLSFC